MTGIQEKLFALKDDKYGDFQVKLIPGISRADVIGVRLPVIRNDIVKQISIEERNLFFSQLPHQYYDENIVHAILISKIKDKDECLTYLNQFLPYVDNWSVCDIIKPNILKKNDLLLAEIKKWIASERTFTCRFGIKMLMDYYLDENFSPDLLQCVSEIVRDDYYVNMMIAWYFATALAKQYDDAIPYLEKGRLSPWVHNKTIQKSIESFRISEEKKNYLRKLKMTGDNKG